MQLTCQRKHGSLKSGYYNHCPQTFRASRLLLISAPSRRVWRSALDVSAPLSFPARSMRENLPCIFPFFRRMIWNTAWLRDEWALADVCPDVLGVRQRRREGEQRENEWRRQERNNCSTNLMQDKNKFYTDLWYEWTNNSKSWEYTTNNNWNDKDCVVIPAAVAHFYEFQDVFCALDLLLLKSHNLHLLFPVFQHPQLSFTIQQVKHLTIHTRSQHWLKVFVRKNHKNQSNDYLSLAFPL